MIIELGLMIVVLGLLASGSGIAMFGLFMFLSICIICFTVCYIYYKNPPQPKKMQDMINKTNNKQPD